MSTVLVVFRKEMTDNLRDRRSIAMAMIYPMIGPLILGLMITFVAGTLKVNTGAAVQILASGAENPPALVLFRRARGSVLWRAPDDPAEAVRQGGAPFVLVLP